MLYLNSLDIKNLFTMSEAIESDKEAFILETNKNTQIPVRINFDVAGKGISSFMPGYLPTYPQVGIKIVSTYPSNSEKGIPAVGATILLLDPETGFVNAVLDGTELTRLRTGAVSGCATDALANKGAEKFALFGTGGQAYSQLEAILTVRKIKSVYIYDKLEDRIPAFIERAQEMADKFNVQLIQAKSPDEAIDEADIITTVTTSCEPVFNGNKIKQGVHINAVGVFLPFKRELDENVLNRADKIFIDNWDAIMSEAGDFLIPMKEGKFSTDRINGELGDTLIGRVEGRTEKGQITLMKTVGFATLDIVIANKVYNKAIAAGAGTNIS